MIKLFFKRLFYMNTKQLYVSQHRPRLIEYISHIIYIELIDCILSNAVL